MVTLGRVKPGAVKLGGFKLGGVTLTRAEQITQTASQQSGLRAVSIDLFDTLVFRKAFDPLAVFALQHAALADACLCDRDQAGWIKRRKETEHRLAQAAAPGEITLAAIYADIREALGWTAEQAGTALTAELRIEAELIEPYTDVVAALGRLEGSGLAIIVQTDTYLPRAFVAEVISRFIAFPYELRCSSETGAPKRSGLAFARLREDFGTSVIHFGDNHAVDVVLARKAGIAARHVHWPRAQLLHGSLQQRYAAALGLHRARTPRDNAPGTPLAELALRWSLVLTDFMLALRHHADEIGATDIWLLSRDCESIRTVAEQLPGVLGGRAVRYIPCSRSSCHPILAVTDPARYVSWGYEADDRAIASGSAAIAFYRSQITPGSRKVLVVDTGWKGRLQAAIASAVPQVAVHGFYFSLEPGAEPDAAERAATFLPWEPRTFNQPVVEALAGFTGSSCARFQLGEDGRPQPVYKSVSLDRSPTAYCDALRSQMIAMLRGATPGTGPGTTARLRLRREAVAQVCAYPDQTVIAAFQDWQIGIQADDSDVGDLLSGGTPSRFDRIIGRNVRGNVWPRAAVWSVVSRPSLVRAIYFADDRAFGAKRLIKRLIKPLAERKRAAAS